LGTLQPGASRGGMGISEDDSVLPSPAAEMAACRLRGLNWVAAVFG